MLYNPGNREETLKKIKADFKALYDEDIILSDDRVWELYLSRQDDDDNRLLFAICWEEHSLPH